MINELLFLCQVTIICAAALIALQKSKETLFCFVTSMIVCANIFLQKQIVLFGLEVTAADSFAIGAGIGLNMLQEYYGKVSARTAIWISFGISVLFTLLSQIHLWYIPSAHDTTQLSYQILFAWIPRIVVASLVTYLIVQLLELRIYSWLQKIAGQWPFFVRNFCSLSICQLFDTVLFSFLGLYGLVAHISHIIILSYSIKMITLICATPILLFFKKQRFLTK